MNEVLKAIHERKSCRSYKKEQISDEQLHAVVDAGLAAPSGRNLQPTYIVAVRNAEDIALMRRINAEVMGTENDPFYGAPCVVVVLAKSGSRTSLEDGCLVLGNMLLAAHALGLGACWIHRAHQTFDTEEGKALLKKWGITDDVFGVGNCILGYVDGELHANLEKRAERAYYID